jgi:hypothetical protein
LIAFAVVNGFWIRGWFWLYGVGLLAGAAMAWRGLDAVNWLLGVCGVTVVKPHHPARYSDERSQRDDDGDDDEQLHQGEAVAGFRKVVGFFHWFAKHL